MRSLLKNISKLLIILIVLIGCIGFFGCQKNEVQITFIQDDFENKIITANIGSKLENLPSVVQSQDETLITVWNIDEDYVVTKADRIYTTSYTKGLEFSKGTFDGKTVYSVSKYTGTAQKVIIPQFYKGGQVRSISQQVFSKNYIITEVVLPEGLSTIGSYAFQDAEFLRKVNLPSTLEDCQSHIFSDSSIEGSLVIPENIETVGLRAFWATKFNSLVITGSATSAGQFAFGGQNCTSVVWGINLVDVYDNTFYMQPINEIFYMGDENDWRNINWIDVDYQSVNASSRHGAKEKLLQEATIYYASDWEYIDGVPTPLD